MPDVSLVREFLWRELRSRFAGSISGGLWAIFQPLIQLAVYSFAFVHIFKATVPGDNPPDYLSFLAVAMWPWFAFSESLLRATTVIQDNAALIGKVALPRAILVFASIAASFLVHITGFIFILAALAMSGRQVNLMGLPGALLLYIPLFVLSIGFALFLSAFQVFVRDLAQALGQLMTLLMFSAPVLYARATLPENYRALMDLHPFTFYAEAFRSLLIDYGSFSFERLLFASILALVVFFSGYWVFRRLDAHFEDFL